MVGHGRVTVGPSGASLLIFGELGPFGTDLLILEEIGPFGGNFAAFGPFWFVFMIFSESKSFWANPAGFR